MHSLRLRSALPWLSFALLTACADPQVGRDADDGDRAQSDFCVQDGSISGAGVLALVNDPSVDAELLDRSAAAGGAGLYSNAANNIIAARPFESLAQLDAVPYVGNSACRALARFACNEQDRCTAPLPVQTWNIEHFPLDDDQTVDAVVELIEDMQPAVIGVQEIESREAFEELLDRLPEYDGVRAARGYFNRVGLIYRTSAVELLQTEDLFVDDSYTFPRSVIAGTFDVLGDDDPTPVTVAVVHLKAFGDATSQARRRAAVEDLRAWVDERREQDAGEIVIVGDWNDKLTDDEDDNVFLPLMEDEVQAEFLTLPLAEDGESSYVPFPSLIDHIWATDEVFDVLDYENSEVLYLDQTWSSEYEQLVSDHRPVQSNFLVRQRFDQ